jgi:hypothetical protein
VQKPETVVFGDFDRRDPVSQYLLEASDYSNSTNWLGNGAGIHFAFAGKVPV